MSSLVTVVVVVVVVVVSVVRVPLPLVSVEVTVSDSITSVTPGEHRPTVSDGQDSSASEKEEGKAERQSDDASNNTDAVDKYEWVWHFIYCS